MCQCVKALVYINQDGLLDINAQNDSGDMALHLASKWGYGENKTAHSLSNVVLGKYGK